MKTLNIGLLGLGQVGTGVYSLLKSKKAALKRDLGLDLRLVKIAVKNPKKKRKVKMSRSLMTSDAMSVIKDPKIDVVVELIGGVSQARKLVLAALKQGKHVVTANKALLAEHGTEIFQAAGKAKRSVLFEASVGGGIPVIKALREGLVANTIDSIHAIINGTSNYILTKMSEENVDFKEALGEAQAKGYAEADPTLDIEGDDAAHKLAILVRFAFGGKVNYDDIYCEGISRIRSEDIAFAKEFGYRVKLLAIAKKTKNGIEARVQPTLLPESHILANVQGSFNAVMMHGDKVGDSLLYGRGAGPNPTASAVVADLVDVATLGSDQDSLGFQKRAIGKSLKVINMPSILSRYYMRFHIVDRPGVLANITRVLGKFRISISDVIQKERNVGNVVPLILLTHDAHEKDVRNAIAAIDKSGVSRGKSQVIRIER